MVPPLPPLPPYFGPFGRASLDCLRGSRLTLGGFCSGRWKGAKEGKGGTPTLSRGEQDLEVCRLATAYKITLSRKKFVEPFVASDDWGGKDDGQ